MIYTMYIIIYLMPDLKKISILVVIKKKKIKNVQSLGKNFQELTLFTRHGT